MAANFTRRNGTAAVDTMAEVANQASEDAKYVVDAILDATDKFSENGKSLIDLQQKLLQSGFGIWKEFVQTNVNFFTDVFQQSLDQTLAVRERVGVIVEYQLKEIHEITTSEQNLAFEAAEAFQAQTKASSERVAEMFIPVSPE